MLATEIETALGIKRIGTPPMPTASDAPPAAGGDTQPANATVATDATTPATATTTATDAVKPAKGAKPGTKLPKKGLKKTKGAAGSAPAT